MSNQLNNTKKEVTRLELMIAVAIIVVLAGVGVPIYLYLMGSTKHAEAITNLNGIKIAQEGYRLSSGTYLDCVQHPALVPDENPHPWVGNPNFDDIGFATASNVRFTYQVSKVTADEFVGEALGDTDGDGDRILFIVTKNTTPHLIGTSPDDTRLPLKLGTFADTSD